MSCKQYTVVVPAVTTLPIVTKSLNEFQAQKFIMSIKQTDGDKQSAGELMVTWYGSVPTITVDHVFYAGVGDTINFQVLASYNGNDVVVEIENNETFSLTIDLAEMGTVS